MGSDFAGTVWKDCGFKRLTENEVSALKTCDYKKNMKSLGNLVLLVNVSVILYAGYQFMYAKTFSGHFFPKTVIQGDGFLQASKLIMDHVCI